MEIKSEKARVVRNIRRRIGCRDGPFCDVVSSDLCVDWIDTGFPGMNCGVSIDESRVDRYDPSLIVGFTEDDVEQELIKITDELGLDKDVEKSDGEETVFKIYFE